MGARAWSVKKPKPLTVQHNTLLPTQCSNLNSQLKDLKHTVDSVIKDVKHLKTQHKTWVVKQSGTAQEAPSISIKKSAVDVPVLPVEVKNTVVEANKESDETSSDDSDYDPAFDVSFDSSMSDSDGEIAEKDELNKEAGENILVTGASKDLAAFMANVGGIEHVILVDPCASVSIVSEQFWNSTRAKSSKLKAYTGPAVRVGDQRAQMVCGVGKIYFVVNDHKFIVEVLVIKNWSHEILLSVQWLREHNAILNFQDNYITIDGIRIKLFTRGRTDNFANLVEDGKNKERNYILVDEVVELPGWSKKLIKVKFLKEVTNGNYWVENVVEGVNPDTCISRGPVTLRSDGVDCYLYLENRSTAVVELEVGVIVGAVEETKFVNCKGEEVMATSTEGSFKDDLNSNISQIISELNIDKIPGLTAKIRKNLKRIIKRRIQAFSTKNLQYEQVSKRKTRVKHRIHTTCNPIFQRPWRTPQSYQKVIKEHIDEMLRCGIIRPGTGAWASPVVLAKKADGTLRFCTDYRKLNEHTKRDVYPLPRIDDVLESLAGAKIFSSFDFLSGFWQVELDEEDKEKTGFITIYGLFEWNVMPFGLCNSPSTFQRVMDDLLRHIKWMFCLVYVDDVIIYSKNEEEHLQHIDTFLKIVCDSGFKIKPKKCNLYRTKLKFLGHIVSRNGIQPDPDKVKTIDAIGPPNNIKDVQTILGMPGYYRKFIPKYALITEPIVNLLRKNVTFEWSERCQKALDDVKTLLKAEPILKFPDHNRRYYLMTDYSKMGISAILSQVFEDGEHPVAYWSRTNKHGQRDYEATMGECYAAVQGVKHFRSYILGNEFTLVTDHSALQWLQTHKGENTRLLKWSLVLQEYYPFEIKWRPGKQHGPADCVSRFPIDESINVVIQWDQADRLIQAQREDPKLKLYFENLIDSKLPADKNLRRRVVTECEHLTIYNGILYHVWLPESKKKGRGRLKRRVVIPDILIPEVLKKGHEESGHFGPWKTVELLKPRVHWNNMVHDITEYCKTCDICQRTKFRTQKQFGSMETIPASEPWEVICIDWIGPINPAVHGYRYIFVVVDYFTRWPEAFACKNKDAKTFALILSNQICSRYLMPKKILSDRDPAFLGKISKDLLQLYNIDKLNTTAYHAQTNGMTERTNKTLIQVMKALLLQHKLSWPELLPFVLQKLRLHVNESIGHSPYEMLYGRVPRIPLDLMLGQVEPSEFNEGIVKEIAKLHKQAQIMAEKSKLRQKARYDEKLRRKPKFKVGDEVLWHHARLMNYEGKIPKKFKSNMYGPFVIIGFIGKNTVRLKNPETNEIISEPVHVEKIKHYHSRDYKVEKKEVFYEEAKRSDSQEIDESSSSDSEEIILPSAELEEVRMHDDNHGDVVGLDELPSDEPQAHQLHRGTKISKREVRKLKEETDEILRRDNKKLRKQKY